MGRKKKVVVRGRDIRSEGGKGIEETAKFRGPFEGKNQGQLFNYKEHARGESGRPESPTGVRQKSRWPWPKNTRLLGRLQRSTGGGPGREKKRDWGKVGLWKEH